MHVAFILGRVPQLAIKEIEAAATILPFQWSISILRPNVALLKPSQDDVIIDNAHLFSLQMRLGGTLKIVLLEEGSVPAAGALAASYQLLMSRGATRKLDFGISVYGKGPAANKIGFSIKDRLKKEAGIGSRFLPSGQGTELSTAQVFHNQLAILKKNGEAQDKGRELIWIEDEAGNLRIGVTATVQDIDSYGKRDFKIPFPDPVSGMLSPKLAQTMVNLAVKNDKDAVVYDPFCGNGRIVEEARMMGVEAFGSDIEPKKVESANLNLAWIAKEYALPEASGSFWLQDATKVEGPISIAKRLPAGKKLYVVCEPFLGKPLRQPLSEAEGSAWVTELTPIYEGFFKAWSTAAVKPAAMVVVFPCAKTRSGSVSLHDSLIDRLQSMGYSLHIVSRYERPDALISRDIVHLSYS